MSTTYLVISALGTDRPGLVAALTEHLAARRANIEESRMVLLGSEFGIMMLVSGTEADLASVQRDLPELESKAGLRMLAKPTHDPRSRRKSETLPYQITVEAIDREGIVAAVSAEVNRLGLNIVSLDTSSFAAPFSGGELFKLEAVVDVPPGRVARELRQALDRLADRENLDIDVKGATLSAQNEGGPVSDDRAPDPSACNAGHQPALALS